jgi:hypothetical protein
MFRMRANKISYARGLNYSASIQRIGNQSETQHHEIKAITALNINLRWLFGATKPDNRPRSRLARFGHALTEASCSVRSRICHFGRRPVCLVPSHGAHNQTSRKILVSRCSIRCLPFSERLVCSCLDHSRFGDINYHRRSP